MFLLSGSTGIYAALPINGRPNARLPKAHGSFRKGTDSRALLTFGGGMEWSVSTRWALRLDLRDYATTFPTNVIVPASGAHLSGWLHDFVAAVGVTFR